MKWREPADGEKSTENPPASEGGRYTGGLAGAPARCGREKDPEAGTGLWLTAKKLNHDGVTS